MRITFSNPLIQTMSGKISKDSDLYYMTRNGKTYLCHRTDRTAASKPSSQMLTARDKFKQMQTMVREIMATTELRKQYEEAFHRQHQYATLRGYIAHCVFPH